MLRAALFLSSLPAESSKGEMGEERGNGFWGRRERRLLVRSLGRQEGLV